MADGKTAPKKTLYRSKSNRILGGVLGGFAEYLNVDASLVRIIFLFLAVLSWGIPLTILYILAWLIIPEQP